MEEIRCKVFRHVNEIKDVGIPPIYQTDGSACADIATPSDVSIPALSSAKIDTLLSFEIPKGYKIVMYPRSSLLIEYGLIQPPSIIDADYTGHVHVPLYNLSAQLVNLPKGTRIAQIECVPAYDVISWGRISNSRNESGFGSTGK